MRFLNQLYTIVIHESFPLNVIIIIVTDNGMLELISVMVYDKMKNYTISKQLVVMCFKNKKFLTLTNNISILISK